VFPEPVTTTYLRPTERVLFHAGRDANPIFHLMEAIWMLAGRNDVAFLEQFNRTIGQYSDNGEVFNAAYGHRWRKHFGHDQLIEVINLLRKDPKSRQAVIQMWDDKDLLNGLALTPIITSGTSKPLVRISVAINPCISVSGLAKSSMTSRLNWSSSR